MLWWYVWEALTKGGLFIFLLCAIYFALQPVVDAIDRKWADGAALLVAALTTALIMGMVEAGSLGFDMDGRTPSYGPFDY